MEIVIDIDDPMPMFNQLMEQIKQAVLSDQIAPQEPLPSIRQLANDLAINSKTVAKAYRLLERDAIIEAKGYRGCFIHPNAKENCSVNLNDWVIKELTSCITALKSNGVTDSEIRIAFNKILTNSNNQGD